MVNSFLNWKGLRPNLITSKIIYYWSIVDLFVIVETFNNIPSVANNKSAKKRIQIAERNRLINKSYKSTVRTLTKNTLKNCEKYKKDPSDDNKNLVQKSLNSTFSLIDKAVKKNVLHKNNGANKKSKINNFVKTTLTSK